MLFNLPFFGQKKPQGTLVKLKIKKMHCSSCSLLIDETLEELPGVFRSNTSYAKAETVVDLDPKLVKTKILLSKVNELGYQAVVVK